MIAPPDNKRKKISATNSKFAMWRCAVALAQADGRMTNSETDLIHEYMSAFSFADEQEKILDNDMRSGVSFDAVYPEVTDKRDRAHLINFARILFHIDGEMQEIESKMLDEIHARHLSTIDLPKILADTRWYIEDYEAQMQNKSVEEKERMSWFERALYSLTLAWDEE